MESLAREFQVFIKPVGPACNLHCTYCYYRAHPDAGHPRMADDLLETCILRHIEACTEPVIRFAWHGGEPTLFGLAGFQRIAALQKTHCPSGRRIVNGIQTNGLLLDGAWCRFLAEEHFCVGLSLDGPQRGHDRHRVSAAGEPTHARVLAAYRRLREHGVPTECLCVVHADNVQQPLAVYDFFRRLEVPFLTFLPLVELRSPGCVTERTVPADAWGEFLCTIFDRWLEQDIGRIKVQIFEEAVHPALGLEHTLCIFRPTCGRVPVLDANGDVYSCDHFVTPRHRLGNLRTMPLHALLDCPQQRAFGRAKQETLPGQCQACAVLDMCHGGCPRNRFVSTAAGEPGLNFLCSGYKRFFTHCRPFVDAIRSAVKWKTTEVSP